MLTIRFQRVGRKNDPAFRIVLIERRSKPKSGELEILGSFHPKTKATQLKRERIVYWLAEGAKASPRAHNLFVTEGVIQGKKIDVSQRPKKTAGAQATRDETTSAPEPAPAPSSTPVAVDTANVAG